MKRMFKWLGMILLILLLLVLITLGVTYFLLGTENGFKFATGQVGERVEGLELGNVSGNLKTGINTDELVFKNDALQLNAKGLESQWQSSCLLKKAFCLNKIIIDELDLETFDTGTEKPEASTEDIVLPEIVLPISFNADEILIKSLRFKAPGDAPAQELKNIRLSAFSQGNALQIDEISTQYQNISLIGNGSITPTGDYPLDLALQIDASDFLEEFDASTVITLSNTVTDLDVDAQVTGAVEASIKGQIKPLEKKLPLTLTINAEQAGWPLDTNTIAQANDISLIVKGDLDDYAVSLNTQVKGEQIPEALIELQADANTERALINKLNINTLDGTVNANAAVSWLDGMSFSSEINANDINPAIKHEGIEGKLNAAIVVSGNLVDGKSTLDLSKAQVNGSLRDLPFDLDAKVSKDENDAWDIDTFVLNNDRNRINVEGKISSVWDLAAQLTLPDLKNFLPELEGAFNATVDVKGALKNPDAIVKARSSSLQYNDISVDRLSLDADVKRGALDKSTVNIKVAKVQAGEQTVSNTALNLSGTQAKHTLTLFADGPQKTSVDLSATGGLNEQFDWAGFLSKVKIEVPAHEINLKDKTALAWNNESKKFSIDPHCWLIQESNLCLENKVLAQETGQAIVSLDAYRLEQLNPFLPADSTLGGKLKTNVVVDWGDAFAGGYAVQLDAGVSNGLMSVLDTSGQTIDFVYDTLSLKTTADAKVIASNLSIDSSSMGQANIDLNLDPASENLDITGKVDLSGFKIDFLKALLPNYETIAGSVSTSGTLSGELAAPIYNGTVIVEDIAVKSDDLPLAIEGGTINIQISGKRARIAGVLQSGEGNINVSGSANWLNDSYRADIRIDSNNLSIVQDPLKSSTVNTALTIAARPGQVRVRGKIEVPAAEINIKELPKGAATLSADVIIIEDVYAATQERRNQQQPDTELDVEVSVALGDKVNLSGYGLNASLTGLMSVTLQSPNPVQLGGEITIVKGIYKQYGQDLAISDGQILFVGPIDQTTLDIDAIRLVEGGERVAGLHIDGRIENPEITLFTDPADKTQESILSYIVLGRDLADASDQEANLLASAALALTLRGGRALTDDLAESLGIQEISLDARGRGNDTEVVVSGRINDRLLLRYGRSVFDDSFTLYLRYDLTKKLYLEAAQGAARAVDIFYSFSF